MKTLSLIITLMIFGFCNAIAQITDQFTDGDFTQNPVWVGDVGDFEINASNQLHLLSVGTDTSALSTANSYMDDAEWNFWFRLSFAPSDNNYVRIYLVSNQSDLKNPLNGYFLRYGENGAADGIDLWRQTGNTLVKIIDGTPNPNAAATNQLIRLKVIRSVSGDWQLFADYAGGYAYQNIGTVTDNTFTSTSFLGVWCKYTTTNATGFYFDDIYAGPIIVDVTPPTVLNVSAIALDSISVIFSEPVTQATATALANYSVSGIGNATSVMYAVSTPDRVKLKLPSPLVSEQSYPINITGVQDFVGNTMSPFLGNVSFYQPQMFDVIISEIMADPTPVVGLPDAEFLELYNRKNIPIDVTGWKVKVNNTVRTIPSGLIPPDSFLVLSINPLPIDFLSINAVGVPSFSALTNTGATVSILSPSNAIIHEVSYSSSWYGDPSKNDGGWTLEMKNLSDFCSGANNWMASEDLSGGTPGRRNSVNNSQSVQFTVMSAVAVSSNQLNITFSQQPDISTLLNSSFSVNNGIGNPDSVVVIGSNTARLHFSTSFTQQTIFQLTVSNTIKNCIQQPIVGNLSLSFNYYLPTPNDVIITEIMADPSPTVGLPDAEYVELYNRTAFPINITGWKIKSGSSVRVIPSGIIPADSFIVLTINPLPAFYTVLNAVAIPSFPAISNTGGTVSILSPTDDVINQVTYALSWYRDGVKDDGGWSLEMINPNDICNGASNWIACQNFVGGTPAARNSVHNAEAIHFKLISAAASGASRVDVYFNQFPNTQQLIPSAFSVNQGIGIPDSIQIISSTSCRLFFSAIFLQQTVYELSVSPTLANCAQEPITGDLTLPFTFYTPQQNDIIITEIMADEDPSQGLPIFEYVEIYNRTALPIQLAGWKFFANNSSVSLPNYLIEPSAYVILTKQEAQTLFSGNVLGTQSFPSLTNSGAALVLKDAAGNQIHVVSYKDTWITESFKRTGGWSLEMKDVNNPCAGKENWAASIHPDGGTPGAQNSISTVLADVSRPRPIRVGMPAMDTLLVYFSEPVKIKSINAPQFNITNGIGNPTAIFFENARLETISLKLQNALQPGILYEITFTDSITDCVGNKIEILFPLRFKLPEFPSLSDVVINEVLFDPKGSGKDYIELFNRSPKAIDLKEMYVGDYDSTMHLITSSKVLSGRSAICMPGEYVLFSTDKTDIYNNYFTENPNAFWDVISLPSMSNSGGSIAFFDNNYTVLDAFTFTDKFHFSLLSNKDGVALERINTETKTQSKYNWTSASAHVGYGTPGYKNSQVGAAADQDDVLTLSPEVFSPDQDGYEDILFIGYEFPQPGNVITINIYNELGQLVKKLVNNEYCGITGQYTWDGGTDNNIRPKVGIYIVMAEWYNENGEKGRAKKVVVLGTRL